MRVDPRFADKSDSFAQTLDGRGNEKIAAQLNEIGIRRFFADKEGLLSHRVEQGLAFFDRLRGTGGNYEELRCRCRFAPAENRSRHVDLTGLLMHLPQTF